MKEKMPNADYQQVINSQLTENRAKFLEKITAPGIFYRSENKSLVMSNSLLFSLKKSIEDGIEIDKDVERIVRHNFG